MKESFQKALMNSAKKLAARPLLKSADTTACPPMQQQQQAQSSQISNTGKALWQSLAQATSQKRSPSYKKSPDSDLEKSSPKGVPVNGGEKVHGNAKDDSESGDGSCNTSSTLGVAVTKQIHSAMDRTPETGAGDGKSSTPEEPTATLGHRWAGWHTEDNDSATEEESIGSTPETSVLEDESMITATETGPLDLSGVVSGEESFCSVASGDHTAAETAENDAESADSNDDDAAGVNTAPNGKMFHHSHHQNCFTLLLSV